MSTVALTAEEARLRASQLGAVLSVSRAWQLGGTDNPFDVSWWCKELNTLLRSGMTVVEALDVLGDSSNEASRRVVLQDLLRQVEAGLPLSRAMVAVGVFPAILVAGVLASERASTLQEALQNYLAHQQLIDRLKRRAVSASIYPALVLTLGVTIVAFLLLYVVPRFSQMYVGTAVGLSPATQFVLTISAWLRDQWWLAASAICFIALSVALAWHEGHLRRLLSWFVAQTPLLRVQRDHFRLAKLYQSLTMMIRGGYTFVESLEVCKGLDLGDSFKRAITRAETLVQQGRGVAHSMAAAKLADLPGERMLAAGECSGNFDHALEIVAERHALAFETFLERATRVVEPLLLLLVAVGVGAVVVLMYMPIFDLASGIGQ